jgi:hypothetical protein
VFFGILGAVRVTLFVRFHPSRYPDDINRVVNDVEKRLRVKTLVDVQKHKVIRPGIKRIANQIVARFLQQRLAHPVIQRQIQIGALSGGSLESRDKSDRVIADDFSVVRRADYRHSSLLHPVSPKFSH